MNGALDKEMIQTKDRKDRHTRHKRGVKDANLTEVERFIY